MFNLLETSKGHWYHIQNEDFPSGVEMPSSTNILEVFPNPGLDFWKENTAPDEIKVKQEEGKAQGTKVHHCCFILSLGDTIDPNIGLTVEQISKLPLEMSEDAIKKDNTLLNYLNTPLTDREYKCLQGFQGYWEEYKPITVAKELKIYHKLLLYAGTLDWVGYLWNKKKKKYELWIVDYKISKSHDRSYESQIVSYFKALCSMYDKRFKAKLGILYLGKPTKKMFQLKEVDNTKRGWDDFILCKKLWHSINPNATPTLVKVFDPIKVDVSFKIKGRPISIKQ